MKSRSGLNLGHLRSKTRSPAEIKRKPCHHCRGHNFSVIFMKIYHNDHLHEIEVKFEFGLSIVTVSDS